MSENKYAGPVTGLVILGVGAVLGGAAALLLGTDDKGEMKPLLKKKVKQAKQKLGEGADWAKETAGELAEKIPANLKKAYQSAQRAVADKVALAKAALEQVDREKYATFVNEVVENMKRAGSVAGTEAARLKTYLMEDYQLVTTAPTAAKPKRAASKRKTKKAAV